MLKLPTSYMAQMGAAGELLTDRTWLYAQYVTLNKSTREVADEIGCGKKAVSTALKRFGIPVRMGVRDKAKHGRTSFVKQASEASVGKIDNREWMHQNFIVLNRSKREIATELSTSLRAVDRWLRIHCLKGQKTHTAQSACSERRYAELNGFTVNNEQASRLRMRGRRGVRLTTRKAGIIWCHSSWEQHVAEYLDQHASVVSFTKDSVCVPYEYDGKQRRYYPDFLVHTAGFTVLVEVKAKRLLDDGRVQAKLAALRTFAELNGWRWMVLSGTTGVDPSTIIGG